MVNGAVTVLTAGYNAEGLRAWKQSAAGSTYSVYDGLTPVVELDGNGTVTAVNTWGAAGLAGRHTTAGSGSSTFYTFDVQGSVSQRLSANGTVQGTYGFDSYGNREGTDNSADPYSGFGGQWGYLRDSETGLSLCGHRYYDAGQGRFINRDPIGYGGGLNVYAYVGSNPLRFYDVSGRQEEDIEPEGSKAEEDAKDEGTVDQYGVPDYIDGLPVLHDPVIEREQAGLPPLPPPDPDDDTPADVPIRCRTDSHNGTPIPWIEPSDLDFAEQEASEETLLGIAAGVRPARIPPHGWGEGLTTTVEIFRELPAQASTKNTMSNRHLDHRTEVLDVS